MHPGRPGSFQQYGILEQALISKQQVYERFMKPSSARSCDARTISDHDLSESHCGAGLGCGLYSATPPVNRKRHTLSSTLCLHHTHTQVGQQVQSFTSQGPTSRKRCNLSKSTTQMSLHRCKQLETSFRQFCDYTCLLYTSPSPRDS